MKKAVLSLFLAAVFTTLLAGTAAFAEESRIVSLSNVDSGKYLDNFYVYTVPSGSDVRLESGSLPSGLSMATKSLDDGLHIFLYGTPIGAGNYSFTVRTVSDEDEYVLQCSLYVNPSAPYVTVGPAQTCRAGDSVSIYISASVNDSGMLNYQWYYNSLNSNQDGIALSGENSPTLSPSTKKIGTLYYYCVVTSTNNGVSARTVSDTIPVTVEEDTLKAITVSSFPLRSRYTVGEELDTNGLTLNLIYNGGREEIISSGFTCSPVIFEKAGLQTVTVSYMGLSCKFEVSVDEPEEIIESISIISKPGKTSYKVGDTLDTTGITLRVYTNLGYSDVTDGFTCTPTKFTAGGEQTVTVDMEGKKCTFVVTVSAEETVQSISVKVMPLKTVYEQGDRLDSNGLVLEATTGSGTKTVTSGYVCSPTVLNTLGDQIITVKYENKTCSFRVTVNAVKDEPTPDTSGSTGTATPAPADNTPKPVVTPNTANGNVQTKRSGGLTAFIIVALILAAVAFGAYMLISRAGGFEELAQQINKVFSRNRRDR